jgi:hypothetical protein
MMSAVSLRSNTSLQMSSADAAFLRPSRSLACSLVHVFTLHSSPTVAAGVSPAACSPADRDYVHLVSAPCAASPSLWLSYCRSLFPFASRVAIVWFGENAWTLPSTPGYVTPASSIDRANDCTLPKHATALNYFLDDHLATAQQPTQPCRLRRERKRGSRSKSWPPTTT